VLVKSNLDEAIEGTADNPLLRGDGADAQQQDHRGRVERIHSLVIEGIEDQWPQRLVLHQFGAHLAQDLDYAAPTRVVVTAAVITAN
jgi:hypothetical protein